MLKTSGTGGLSLIKTVQGGTHRIDNHRSYSFLSSFSSLFTDSLAPGVAGYASGPLLEVGQVLRRKGLVGHVEVAVESCAVAGVLDKILKARFPRD